MVTGRLPGRWARWVPFLVLGAYAAVLRILEIRHPLRAPVASRSRRALRNVAIALPAFAATGMVERPLADGLAGWVGATSAGWVGRLPLPLRIPLAVVLLDYSLYLWHILLHRVPLLWRYHAVHHVDEDLDSTTALRFHFGEFLLSVPWRLAQIRIIGAEPVCLRAWRWFTGLSILFHHSNLRLPASWESRLGFLITTPRLHGIHHSRKRGESLSNFSSGLAAWDFLHGTLRREPSQEEIRIGAPGYPYARGVGLRAMLAMPFRSQAA